MYSHRLLERRVWPVELHGLVVMLMHYCGWTMISWFFFLFFPPPTSQVVRIFPREHVRQSWYSLMSKPKLIFSVSGPSRPPNRWDRNQLPVRYTSPAPILPSPNLDIWRSNFNPSMHPSSAASWSADHTPRPHLKFPFSKYPISPPSRPLLHRVSHQPTPPYSTAPIPLQSLL